AGHSSSLNRRSAAPPRRRAWVRDQSYEEGRQPTVAVAPVPHRLEHALAGPAWLNGAGVAPLAVRVGVALAVARLRIGAAATAHADVARLYRPSLLAGRVVEVGLDRRRRAAKAVSDLLDRETLRFTEMVRQCDGAASLD